MNRRLLSATLLLSIFSTGCLPQSSRSDRQVRELDSSRQSNESPNPLYTACAQESCGLAQQLPFITAPISEAHHQKYQQDLKKSVDELSKLEQELFETKKSAIQKFSSVQISQVSDNYKTLLNFLHFSGYGGAISEALVMTANRIQISENVMTTKLSHVPRQEVNWLISAAKTIFESDLYYANYYLSQFPLEVFVRRLYPNMDALDAIAKEARALLVYQNEIVQNYPILQTQSANRMAVLTKATQKQPLDPREKQEFISHRFSILTMKELLPQGRWRPVFLSRQVNISQLANSLLQRAQQSSLLKLNTPQIILERERTQSLCEFALTSTIASSPTPEQNQKFAANLDQVKREALQVLSKSQYGALHVQEAITKVNLLLPPTQQETLVGLKRTIHQEIQNSQDLISNIKNWQTQKQADQELFLLMLATNFGSEDNSEVAAVFENTNEFCASNSPQGIEDAAYSNYQIVNVGWRSILYPQFGYGILGHELAHVISLNDENSSQPIFNRVKECLKQNQKGRKELVEEDFADLFATQLMKLRRQETRNFACILLRQKDREYSGLSLETQEGGVHPSSFYRLISIATHTQTLTPRCEEAKASHPMGQRLQDCWGR